MCNASMNLHYRAGVAVTPPGELLDGGGGMLLQPCCNTRSYAQLIGGVGFVRAGSE